MTDGQNPISPTVTHKHTGNSEDGHVCVCTQVKFYFFNYCELNSCLSSIVRKGKEEIEQPREKDVHLSHRLFKRRPSAAGLHHECSTEEPGDIMTHCYATLEHHSWTIQINIKSSSIIVQ